MISTIRLSIISLFLLFALPVNGAAQLNGGQLHVDFDGTPLDEALEQLQTQTGITFELRFVPPEDAALDGQFRLPLTQALRRLFTGFNFTGHYRNGRLERVVIMSLRGSGAGLSSTRTITPEQSSANGESTRPEVSLRRDSSGHYRATALLNGAAFGSMVDTGATVVTVSMDVAQNLGLPLGIRRIINTANGPVEGHSTQLQNVQIGDLKRDNVEAVVLPSLESGQVLLGMNFLGAFEIRQRDDVLTLRAPSSDLPGFGTPPTFNRP